MGYDMYVRGAGRDEQDTYLRRNIFGMWPTLEAMALLGMVEFTESPKPPTPPEPYADHVQWSDDEDADIGVTDEGRAYLSAVNEVLVRHVGDTPLIPSGKFNSNDGWHVTKEECIAALDAYDKAMADGKEHHSYLGQDVIPFLRKAAERDGFEVR